MGVTKSTLYFIRDIKFLVIHKTGLLISQETITSDYDISQSH